MLELYVNRTQNEIRYLNQSSLAKGAHLSYKSSVVLISIVYKLFRTMIVLVHVNLNLINGIYSAVRRGFLLIRIMIFF